MTDADNDVDFDKETYLAFQRDEKLDELRGGNEESKESNKRASMSKEEYGDFVKHVRNVHR